MRGAVRLYYGLGLLAMAPAPAWAAEAAIPTASLSIIVMLGGAALVGAVVWRMCRSRYGREAVRLAEHNAYLSTLLAHAPAGWVYWDSRQDLGVCSERLESLLGQAGGPIRTVEQLSGRLTPGSSAALCESMARLCSAGRAFTLTVEAADGEHAFEVVGTRSGDRANEARHFGDHVILWFNDITALRSERAHVAGREARAIAARDRFKDMLEALPFPVWRRNADLDVSWCNTTYAGMVEAESTAAVTDQDIELVATGHMRSPKALAYRARDEGGPRSETRHIVVQGDRRTFEITESPLAESDEILGFAHDVSDIAEARQELTPHVDAHATVLESLDTAVAIFGPDERLKFHNRAYARLWRFDENWLTSQPLHGAVLEQAREQRRLPEQADFPAYKNEVLGLYTSLLEPKEEMQHLPDGTTIRTVTVPHPHGGLLFFYEDVSDRFVLERARNTLLAVQRETLDHLWEGIAVFGSDGQLKLFNPVYARLWELDEEFLATQPHVSDIVDRARPLLAETGDWEALKTRIIAATLDRTPRFSRLERSDDVVLDYAGVPLPDGSILFTYLDVSDGIRIERALRDRAEALEAGDKLKSKFIENVSYELRTPLNTVIGFTEILKEQYFGTLNARQSEYAEGILDSSEHLLSLINNIIDLATIEAGHMDLEGRVFDLHTMLASVLSLTRGRVQQQDLTLDFDCPVDIGELDGDERRVKQVVFNLLSNAIKFTPPGGEITLGARREPGEMVLWVADTGEGIPP